MGMTFDIWIGIIATCQYRAIRFGGIHTSTKACGGSIILVSRILCFPYEGEINHTKEEKITDLFSPFSATGKQNRNDELPLVISEIFRKSR